MVDEFVRIRGKNGLETSVPQAYLDGLEKDDLSQVEILKGEPTTGAFGRTLPVTRKGGRQVLPVTTVDEEVRKKTEENK